MKVGILFDGLELPPKNGVTFRFYYLSKELASKGIEVVVFLCDRGWVSKEQLKKEPFRMHLFSPEVFYKKIEFVKGIIEKERPDILQVNNSASVLWYGARYSQELEIPLVTEMHDCDATIKETLRSRTSDIDEARFIQYVAGEFSHQVICMTEKDRGELIDIGIDKRKINLAPNGIDTNYFSYNLPNLVARRIVFLGNMFYPPNRNAVEMLARKVMPKLKVELLCIGMVSDALKNKYSSSKIKFSGGIDDIRPILKNCSVAVAPILEGSGMKVKLLNYAAAGLPIITTKVGISGYPAKIARVEDNIARYPHLILQLLDNPKLSILQSKAARNIVCKEFSLDVISKKVATVYQKTRFTRQKNIIPSGFSCNETDKNYKILLQKTSPLPLWLEEKRAKFTPKVPNHIKINC